MVKGLYTGYTGMVNSQKRLDVISNNLANATTTGFKAEGCTTQAFDFSQSGCKDWGNIQKLGAGFVTGNEQHL